MSLAAVREAIKRLGNDQKGAIALMTAVAALPMLMVAGTAVDYIKASNYKSRLQSALDAGALAAATSTSMSDAERVEIANAVFARNWAEGTADNLTAMPKFAINKNGVVASASVGVPTSFLRIAGIKNVDVGADVDITIPEMKNAEIALVLDYSESMTETSGGKVKYIAMREAATKLMEDLKTAAKDRVKVGLVPFSHQVRVTLPKEFVKGESGPGNWTGCTQDRLYPYNLSDETPDEDDDDTKWNQSVLMDYGDCSGYAPRNLRVYALDDNLDTVSTRLNAMRPYKYTHISLGVEFGWHVLSPNAPFKDAAAYDDEKTQKYMVVLTDGLQTERAFGNGARTVRWGERNLETLCGKVKKEGIKVITIAFDLEDDATRNRLRNCATDPDENFFIAEDSADVARAFEDITKQISAQVYVSR